MYRLEICFKNVYICAPCLWRYFFLCSPTVQLSHFQTTIKYSALLLPIEDKNIFYKPTVQNFFIRELIRKCIHCAINHVYVIQPTTYKLIAIKLVVYIAHYQHPEKPLRQNCIKTNITSFWSHFATKHTANMYILVACAICCICALLVFKVFRWIGANNLPQ